MKGLVYADIHSKKLDLLEDNIDFIFLLGDIYWTDLKKIDLHYSCPKFGVLGNHDVLDSFIGTSIIDMHNKIIDFNGLKIGGFSGCPRYNQKQNSVQYTEIEARNMLLQWDQTLDIFLTHSNPSDGNGFGHVTDAHRGFDVFHTLYENLPIKQHFHGHMHENKQSVIHKTIVTAVHGLQEINLNL